MMNELTVLFWSVSSDRPVYTGYLTSDNEPDVI
jgi:hypothetical protein